MDRLRNAVSVLFVASQCVVGCQPQEREERRCSVESECAADEICFQKICTQVECKRDNDCAAGKHCLGHECVTVELCRTDSDCLSPTPVCDLDSGKCVACVPDCAGRCCGADGCGGECMDRCHATGQACNSKTCVCEGECVPDCLGKECGPDGCKGTCAPGCAANEFCNVAGGCECAPACAGKECGPDGCGGECAPGCGGRETCNAVGKCAACQQDCGSRECGLDPVCGVSCGECQAEESCNVAGVCGPWCQIGQARCTADGFGFQACGPDPADPEQNTFGSRVPCVVGDTCAAISQSCARNVCLQSEIVFLLDRSSSMQSGDTWTWVKQALLDKLGERQVANLFGFREFPSGGGCNTAEVVPMEKSNARRIEGAIHDPTSDSATPIGKALQGFGEMYGDANDGQAVVLLTDGDETAACGTQEGAVAGAGALWRAGVKVYAVAVTTMANKGFLDQLAQAGGTGNSRLVTSGTELEQALETVFRDIDACRCAKDQTRCDAGKAQTCAPDGRSFQFREDCPLGCAADGLDCQLCDPDSTRCQGDQLLRCSAERKSFEFEAACELGCIDETRCREPSLLIPAGALIMGSDPDEGYSDELPEHEVTLDPFYIDTFEVTNAEYSECVTAGVCTKPVSFSSRYREDYYGNPTFAHYPVLYVSWNDARAYCRWRGRRLPSEAEWERAARGPKPSERTYPWGEGAADCSLANFSSCGGDTKMVGSHPNGATPERVFDLAGNVSEWVEDWYGTSYYASTASSNPLGPETGNQRVFRGGNYSNSSQNVRVSVRWKDDPTETGGYLGIRCAKSPAGVDHDGDGYSADEGDCDDSDPLSNPGAVEVCDDGRDNDCNGTPDDKCDEPIVLENDTDVQIPDGTGSSPGSSIASQIEVTPSRLLKSVEVHLHIQHPYIGDLKVTLIHPGGTSVTIRDQTGGDANNIDASYPVASFVGKGSQGTWTLTVQDFSSGDTGILDYWSLILR